MIYNNSYNTDKQRKDERLHQNLYYQTNSKTEIFSNTKIFLSVCMQRHYYNLESTLQSQHRKSIQLSILKFYLKCIFIKAELSLIFQIVLLDQSTGVVLCLLFEA